MNKLMTLTAAALAATTAAAADIYVSLETGKNKNDGTKEAPLKNLWKALENAKDGDTIHLAEGIYPGKMKQNWFLIDKAVSIIGGYSKDFAERKPLEHKTMFQARSTGRCSRPSTRTTTRKALGLASSRSTSPSSKNSPREST